MKIAIVRGPSLNEWEMQSYEPIRRRHNLLTVGSTKPLYPLQSLKIPVVKLPCLGQLLNRIPKSITLMQHTIGDPGLLLGFDKTVRDFDIVHTAECANYYSLQAVRAKQKKLVKKVVVTVWENIPYNREGYPAQKKLKARVRQGADFFLAASGKAKEALITEGAAPSKIAVISMGVDLSRFRPVARRKKKLTNILFAGRLEEEKGIWELAEAFKSLEKGVFSLTIVGGGSQADKLREWIYNHGLQDYIHLAGNINYENMPKIYNDADIFILPSKTTDNWQEQYGMVLIEAMACGLPVIASNSGSIPETVIQAAILVKPNSRAIFREIINIKNNKSLRIKLREKAIALVRQRYDREETAKKIEILYQQVLKI